MIFSTHPLHPEIEAGLAKFHDYQVASSPTREAIENESAGSEIIVVRAPIPTAVILRETGLRALIRHGAGLDMIPLDAATTAGVIVANVPGVNAITVAEHVIWSSLALLRKFPEVDSDLRNLDWNSGRAHSDNGRELSGKSLGIIGLGNVGKALLRIARDGFGMQVRVFVRDPAKLPIDVEYYSLDELLQSSDMLALCCPLTPETRGLIGETELDMMKRSAILVNVARGPVVHEQALVDALTRKNIAGAALDVFETQPLAGDHPFLKMKNVILTPHMAGITEESMLRMGQGVLAATQSILSGHFPDNFVNPDCTGRYQERFGRVD